jgi:hypothetical protein
MVAKGRRAALKSAIVEARSRLGKLKDALFPENGEPSLGVGSMEMAGARCLPTSGMLMDEASVGSFGERGTNNMSLSRLEVELKRGS